MAVPTAVADFAALLAAEQDETKRSALLKRVKMLAMNQAVVHDYEPPVSSLADYLDNPIPTPPALVWPTLVVRGELTAVVARAGRGKTTVNLLRMIKWSAGRPLFDNFKSKDGETYLRPDGPLKILIVENEGSAGMFQKNIGRLVNNCGDVLSDEDRKTVKENIFIWGDGGYSNLKLDDPVRLDHLRAGVDKVKPDILFIEPFRSLWKGEENSSTDMAVVVDNLVGLATDYSCGVVLSHHERKSGAGEEGEPMSAGRGSTVLEGVVAVMENWNAVKGGQYREMKWSKSRYLPPPIDMRVEYDVDSGWYNYVGIDAIEAGILQTLGAALDEPLSKGALALECSEKPDKLSPVLKKLEAAGRIVRMPPAHGSGGNSGFRYRLPTNDSTEHGGLAVG